MEKNQHILSVFTKINKKFLGIFVIGAIILAIPITITLVGQQQDIRQHAAELPCYQNLPGKSIVPTCPPTNPTGSSNNYTFRVLVDTNQIHPDEAAQASRFAADGVWSMPLNSPTSLTDWVSLMNNLGAYKWTVSEENPTTTTSLDATAKIIGRIPDGTMNYNEDGWATPLSDEQINSYAAHTVPDLGQLGPKIVLLTRSYGTTDPRRAQLDHALQNPNVNGATFEFAAGSVDPNLKFEEGCQHILSLGKKCYFLIPPNPNTQDYLGDVQKVISYFQPTGLLSNPNVFFVPAVYVRPNNTHFLNTSDTDHNSMEAVVKWLNDYRGIQPSQPQVSQVPKQTNQKPIGYFDGLDNNTCSANGWTIDPDVSSQSIKISVLADAPNDGHFIGTYTTDQSRPDVNDAAGASGNHGFFVKFNPANDRESFLFDGQPHPLYIYGLDAQNDNNNALLGNSPKTITCQKIAITTTPSLAPTLTGMPALSPTISVQPNTTYIKLAVKMPGIGPKENNKPSHPLEAEIHFETLDKHDALTTKASLAYNPQTGFFEDTTYLGMDSNNPEYEFKGGDYIVEVRSTNSLWKLMPYSIHINEAAVNETPQITLTPGDFNRDNIINILDYNLFMSCFGNATCNTSLAHTQDVLSANYSPGAIKFYDLNYDGKVDEEDLNILYRSFAVRSGD